MTKSQITWISLHLRPLLSCLMRVKDLILTELNSESIAARLSPNHTNLKYAQNATQHAVWVTGNTEISYNKYIHFYYIDIASK